jgi:streptogramin lyase
MQRISVRGGKGRSDHRIPHPHAERPADADHNRQRVSLGHDRGPDGNVWFVERNGNKIGRITPEASVAPRP